MNLNGIHIILKEMSLCESNQGPYDVESDEII